MQRNIRDSYIEMRKRLFSRGQIRRLNRRRSLSSIQDWLDPRGARLLTFSKRKTAGARHGIAGQMRPRRRCVL